MKSLSRTAAASAASFPWPGDRWRERARARWRSFCRREDQVGAIGIVVRAIVEDGYGRPHHAPDGDPDFAEGAGMAARVYLRALAGSPLVERENPGLAGWAVNGFTAGAERRAGPSRDASEPTNLRQRRLIGRPGHPTLRIEKSTVSRTWPVQVMRSARAAFAGGAELGHGGMSSICRGHRRGTRHGGRRRRRRARASCP